MFLYNCLNQNFLRYLRFEVWASSLASKELIRFSQAKVINVLKLRCMQLMMSSFSSNSVNVVESCL